MLLGAASAGTGYIPTKLYEYADYYGAYFQDDIRITKSLTVNIGMRWEREYGLQEKNNYMVVGFDTKTVNPLAANVTGILPKGVIQFAGVNGNSIHVSNPNLNKLAPRIGIAWQVAPKTTIRGGYGMFWAPQFAIGTPYNPPGYTATSTYIASNDGNATPANYSNQPVPGGLARPTGSTLGDLTGIGQSLTSSIRMRARRACSSTPSMCSANCRSAWRWKWATSDRTPRTSRRRRPTSTSTR